MSDYERGYLAGQRHRDSGGEWRGGHFDRATADAYHQGWADGFEQTQGRIPPTTAPKPDRYVYPSGFRAGELVDLLGWPDFARRPLGRVTHPGPRPIPGRVYVVTVHGTFHYHPDSLARPAPPRRPEP